MNNRTIAAIIIVAAGVSIVASLIAYTIIADAEKREFEEYKQRLDNEWNDTVQEFQKQSNSIQE